MTREPGATLFAEEHAYDTMPYDSFPIFQAAPARLAAIATLYGLTPPNVETAHVLELGCAAGGHIIPLALQYPQAHFVGIDISGVQIREGQARIARLGLRNIELRKQSLTELNVVAQSFDYIISHGLFSWVPEVVRQAILRISHDCLRRDGLAFVSYNALPGWHLKRVLRDLLVFHTEQSVNDQAGLAAAREILTAFGSYFPASYGDVIAAEAEDAVDAEAYFLKHDYLERENKAFLFSEFMKQAHAAGLRYVSDADTMGTLSEGFDRNELLAKIGPRAADPLRFEQYSDYATGRMFRMSILTKALDTAPAPALLPDQLRQVHFRSVPLKLRNADADDDAMQTILDEMDRVRTSNAAEFAEFPFTARAIEILLRSSDEHPSTFTLRTLSELAASPNAPSAVDDLMAQQLVHEMFSRRLLQVYAHEIRVAESLIKPASGPQAITIARHDAAAGLSTTTNLFHEKISLNDRDRFLLPLLDGTHDVAALDAKLAPWLAERADIDAPSLNVETKAADAISPSDQLQLALAHYLKYSLIA